MTRRDLQAALKKGRPGALLGKVLRPAPHRPPSPQQRNGQAPKRASHRPTSRCTSTATNCAKAATPSRCRAAERRLPSSRAWTLQPGDLIFTRHPGRRAPCSAVIKPCKAHIDGLQPWPCAWCNRFAAQSLLHDLASHHLALPRLWQRADLPPQARRRRHARAGRMPRCHTIHYENPLNVVGKFIPVWGDQVFVFCATLNRAVASGRCPQVYGAGETTQEGQRAKPRKKRARSFPLAAVQPAERAPGRSGTYFYRAELLSAQFNPRPETQQAQLFREQDIPWDELAFRTVKTTLECFFRRPAPRPVRRALPGYHLRACSRFTRRVQDADMPAQTAAIAQGYCEDLRNADRPIPRLHTRVRS